MICSLAIGVATLLSLSSFTNALPALTGYGHHHHPSTANGTYDYVVVGGGTAGLTVANRLTEDPSVTVLVVEYGYLDQNFSVLIPYEANFNNFRDLYNITSAPIVHLNNEPNIVLAAATVGGGSVVNGMFFDRASALDYDAWEQLGNPGWGWEGMLPYFIKSTNFTPPTAQIAAQYNYTWNASVWGTDGPIHASIAPWQWPEEPLMFTAWSELDDGTIPYPVDGGDGSGVGVFWVPNSEDPTTETRSDAKTGYYDPIAATRPNLHLVTGTKVDKVTFAGKTANGIQMTSREDNTTVSAYAKREVIMAAGPVFSSQLLQLSGVGPCAMLEAAGIDVVYDLPGVGMNFQDHPTLYGAWNYTKDFPINPGLLATNATYLAEAEAEYYANRSGPWVQAHGNSAAFLSLRTINPMADEIVNMALEQNTSQYLPAMYDDTSRAGYAKQHALLVQLLNSTDAAMYEFPFAGSPAATNAMERPLSRGTISLNTSDPTGLPIVDYNTLANPIDGLLAVSMVNFTRRYFHTPTMSQLGPVELVPGANYTSTEQLLEVFTTGGLLQPTFAHPSCSNPMMPLEYGGVVSDQLLVYGVEHLSVVDVSIIPMIPATHLCNTVYAIAEKAADIIKARHANDTAHGGWSHGSWPHGGWW